MRAGFGGIMKKKFAEYSWHFRTRSAIPGMSRARKSRKILLEFLFKVVSSFIFSFFCLLFLPAEHYYESITHKQLVLQILLFKKKARRQAGPGIAYSTLLKSEFNLRGFPSLSEATSRPTPRARWRRCIWSCRFRR